MRLMRLTRRLSSLGSAVSPQRRQATLAGLISIVLRAVLLLGKFAFIVALAKFTDTATVGVYALLVTIVSIAIYVIGLEIHTYTGREIVADQGDGQGAIHVQSHFVTVTGLYLIAVPVIWGVTLWLRLDGKFSFAPFAAIILLEVFGQELGRYLLMLSRPVASNVLQFIRGAAWMPVPIVMLLLGHSADAIDTVLWTWLGGSLVACLFGFWRIRRFLMPLHRFNLDWLGTAFQSARHYFAVALLTQVQYYSDRFVVQYFMGESAVGILSFYQSFAGTMVAFVQTGVVSLMLPRLILAGSRDDRMTERHVRRSMFTWAILLAVVISLGLAVGMPFLLQQMNKADYQPALPIFYVLLLGNLILVIGMVAHLSLYARRQDAQLMRVSLIVIPLGLAANILAVTRFGIAGAAFVLVMTASLDLALKYWLLRRSYR